jgi:hypothetical protein
VNDEPTAPEWSASAAWPFGVLVAGFGITATLMWVSWLVGTWVQVRGVADWLLDPAYFLPPYALCAAGLWLGRDRRRRWLLRGAGLLVVAFALPALYVAADMVHQFRETGTKYGILAHMFAAFLTLPFQYALGVIALFAGRAARRRPIEIAADPKDAAW